MKEIDLVPEEKRSAQQYQRTALIHQYYPVISAIIVDTCNEGARLSDVVILILDTKMKNLVYPKLPDPTSDDIPGHYVIAGPRKGFREMLEAISPGPETYECLDTPPAENFVYVAVAAFGGITVAAIGEIHTKPPAVNVRVPNSPNN